MCNLNIGRLFASVTVLVTCMDSFGQVMTSAEMAEYAKKATCAVAGYEGEGVNESFRLLVRVSPKAIAGFDYADVLSAGKDVRFVTADGTVLPHELDTWNPAGESTFWVLLPKLERGQQL